MGALTVAVKVAEGGGVRIGASGVEVDPGRVSMPGHTHEAGSVTGLGDAVATVVSELVADSLSVGWEAADGLLSPVAKLAAAGGLKVDASGLAVDLGVGATQAAAGNHSHDGLHAPVTGGETGTARGDGGRAGGIGGGEAG